MGHDFDDIPAFYVREPASQRVPFVFSSPHSGRHYPPRFLAQSRLDADTIRRSEDCYVEELFGSVVGLGAPLIAANFPRAWLDVNREPYELDPRMFIEQLPAHFNTRSPRVAGGLGTIPRLVGEGLEIYRWRLPFAEAQARIDGVYRPFHERLKSLVMRTRDLYGYCVLVDCHSMPASIRVGDGLRPDFIIGDRFGSSADQNLSEHAIALLVSMGYTVAHNKPYAGGFITEHYGRPARGMHTLQIEINRGLYLDETTYRKTAGFAALAEDLARFTAALSAFDIDDQELPIAAE